MRGLSNRLLRREKTRTNNASRPFRRRTIVKLRAEQLEDRRLLATFTVTNTNDAGSGSLRQAILDANGLAGADQITFEPTLSGEVITLGGAELSISDSVTIDASALDENVTIDANHNSRVINFIAISGDLSLLGVTVTGGHLQGTNDSGAGVSFESDGTLTLTDSIVSGNTATGDFSMGGGIRARTGSVTLTGTTVSGNVVGNSGGGIFTTSGSISLTASIVSGNSATGRFIVTGGGIFTLGGSVTLTDSTVSENVVSESRSSYGGGIYSADGVVTLMGSTLSGNSSADRGGGIDTRNGEVIVTDSLVSANTAEGRGGAIYSREGQLTLTDTTMSGNTAGSGAVFNFAGPVSMTRSAVSGNSAYTHGGGIRTFLGPLTLTDSAVTGNSARLSGGGIAAFSVTLDGSTISGNSSGSSGGAISSGSIDFVSSVTLTRSTITANTSSTAGGVFFSSNAYILPPITTIENSIIAGNLDDGTAPDFLPHPTGSLTINYSLIGVADGLGTITGNQGNVMGSAAMPANAMLDALADNGGPTPTHALLPGSPAINTGDPSAVAGMDGVPQFDQRGAGFARVVGGRIDMGSFEVQDAVTLACDFDGDEICDGIDIDLLQANLVWGPADPSTFDLTGDGLVTVVDRNEWLTLAGAENLPSGNPYRLGDANLDGFVDGPDFVAWNDNKFTSSSAWTEGDFNADGVVDGPDFVVWNDHKFQNTDLQTVHNDAASLVRDRCFTELNWGEEEDDTPSRLQTSIHAIFHREQVP